MVHQPMTALGSNHEIQHHTGKFVLYVQQSWVISAGKAFAHLKGCFVKNFITRIPPGKGSWVRHIVARLML